jgi:hypothetical protein
MSVINIREAEREGARLVIGLAALSGGGKTFTALQLAFGLANYNSKKVGLLDTENRRGSLYANVLTVDGQVQKFLIGDLYAPFSPQRYKEAILEFQKTGIEVLVIDSVSHEWEGQGGCEDIANAGNPKIPRWNEAKAQHKAFMNALLQSDMHVIVCMRAREKAKPVKDQATGKTVFESQGVLPICEKNFTFELTASLMLWDGGKARQVLKCPAELEPIFGKTGEWAQGYLTADAGKALRDWVDGAKSQDPEVERHRNSLRTVTEKGVAALGAAWAATPKKIQKALGEAFKDELKRAAEGFDTQRRNANEGGQAVAELNDRVLGSSAQPAA